MFRCGVGVLGYLWLFSGAKQQPGKQKQSENNKEAQEERRRGCKNTVTGAPRQKIQCSVSESIHEPVPDTQFRSSCRRIKRSGKFGRNIFSLGEIDEKDEAGVDTRHEQTGEGANRHAEPLPTALVDDGGCFSTYTRDTHSEWVQYGSRYKFDRPRPCPNVRCSGMLLPGEQVANGTSSVIFFWGGAPKGLEAPGSQYPCELSMLKY